MHMDPGKKLQQHGDYVSHCIGQVVVFIGRGPWNDESLYHGSKKLSDTIDLLDKSKPWAQFSLLIGESLMPPTAFDMFVKQTSIRKQKGLNALAIVIKNSDVKNTIKHQLSNAYNQAGVEHQFFESFRDANQWLNDKGYTLSLQKLTDFIDSCDFAN